MKQNRPASLVFAQVVIAVAGISNLLAGAALLFAPEWFYTNIGNFPPFNRHYAGDLGTFLLPLGAGLLWAARNPAKHVGIIAVGAAGNLLHSLNHLYDAINDGITTQRLVTELIPLLVVGFLLTVVAISLLRPRT
jgi:hypothetical protein